jgi:hypothetical protein
MDYVEIKLELPKPPSLNKIYAGQHWAVRKKYKDDYKKECQKQLEKLDDFVCNRIQFFITYNSRLDIDNGILVAKFLADTLVSEGIIPNDNPKYYDKVTLEYDLGLPKNTYLVKIKCFGYAIVE